jgi:hypothetical protein
MYHHHIIVGDALAEFLAGSRAMPPPPPGEHWLCLALLVHGRVE